MAGADGGGASAGEADETEVDDRLVPRVLNLLGSSDDRVRLMLEFVGAVARVRGRVDEVMAGAASPAAVLSAVAALDEVVAPVARSLAWVASWGLDAHERIVLDVLRRLVDLADQQSGDTTWIALRRWPAVVGLTAVGVGGVDGGRERVLARALVGVSVRQLNATLPAAIALQPAEALDPSLARTIPGRDRQLTPVDQMLEERLALWLVPDLLGSQARLLDCFDRYQYLAGLVGFDEQAKLTG